MSYCRNLGFDQRPDYRYLKRLFTSVANKEGINLHDNRFDWATKAVAIKNYHNFYNFLKRNYVNPFDSKGNFIIKKTKNKDQIKQEKEIYVKAQNFEFYEPK